MSDDPDIRLPPLPLPFLKRLQEVEAWTRTALLDCSFPGSTTLDARKARETMRSAIVADLDIRLDHYETLPLYDWNWSNAIGSHSVAAILACFPSSHFERYGKNDSIEYEEDHQFLDELSRTGWDHMVTRRAASRPIAAQPAAIEQPGDRKGLVAAYRTAFPNAGILDICWAAEQSYREWTRWLKGEIKDGSKPDRAFRHVLKSNKDARKIRNIIRPKGWK